jgi:superoxide dismutase, Cu-Zn family
MLKLRIFLTIGIFLGISVLASSQMKMETAPQGIEKAVAVIYPASGSSVHGLVTFTQSMSGIKVVADIEGLTPGKHGFHIHEYGDCSSPDAVSAGGHFNPDNMQHGGPMTAQRHVGDLGNIQADDKGKAHFELTDKDIAFSGPHSIIGRAVVIHSNEDDLKTAPAGNAGPRIACGVIGISH